MVVLNTPEKSEKIEKTAPNCLINAFHNEIDTYWSYAQMAKSTDESTHRRALWEIMEDEYLHARYLRAYMIEHEMYDMDDPWEKKYRDVVSDIMVKKYGWDD